MTLSLAEYESKAIELCFAAEVTDEELAAVGDAARWRTYRNMVRARLLKVCQNALPRTRDAIGDERFEALFVAWLADAPPKHRYFREVPLGFLEHATPAMKRAEPWLHDLARYELTTWCVKFADDRNAPDVVDVDFESPIVLHESLALLELGHVVHLPVEGHDYPAEPTWYAVYRANDFRAVTMILTPMAHALLGEWSRADGTSLAEKVRTVTSARGRSVDAGFIDGLSTMLADFIERGIVRGSLPPRDTP